MATTTAKKHLNKSIDINATRERIWNVLLGKETFEDWASGFNPSGGSYFEGDWSKGSTMRFLGPDDQGNTGGMLTKITEHVPGEYVRAEHYGVIGNGQEIFEGEIFDEWIPSVEEYRLTGGPDTYTLQVQNDVPESYYDHFSSAWDKALARVKELAEK